MSKERNKSYRIRTEVGKDTFVSVKLDQDYDTFDILSLTLEETDSYKLHNSDYGVIVGRVLANNGFGVPNAKVSVFISADSEEGDEKISALYPYSSPKDSGMNDIRYNLLPDNKVSSCHQIVGDFPNKIYMLSESVLMEVFDKYYKLTARTNDSGDYMIAGVPTGQTKIHMDLDLSDCGILSQKPRDFTYKGYNIEQFESPTVFKTSKNLDSLSQIVSQDTSVYVYPFWGNDELGETIGITRCDIDVNFKFEPTAVFIGSIVSDPSSNGLSKKCVPTNQMGAMDELTTGKGTIEMIRKTPGGDTEVFAIKGTELINGDGVWCYQIPMNLDYIMTDEYGNVVPTDDPNKGLPTRTRVRFRVSMEDFENNRDKYFRGKILVPHNPQYIEGNVISGAKNANEDKYDYVFGTKTKDESYRDLLWNNVYTVKQFFPRFQKSQSYKTERFTGIKHCNYYGNNNPMPYNNMRIRLPFMFRIMCALIKAYIRIVTVVNNVIYAIAKFLVRLSRLGGLTDASQSRYGGAALSMKYVTVADGLCPDLENWYFAPNKHGNLLEKVFTSEASGSKDGPNNMSDEDNDYYTAPCWRPVGNDSAEIATLEIIGSNAQFFVCAIDKKYYTSLHPYSLNDYYFTGNLDGKGDGIKNVDYDKKKLPLETKLNFEGTEWYINFDFNGSNYATLEPNTRKNHRLDGTSKATFRVTTSDGVVYEDEFAFWYDETERNDSTGTRLNPTWYEFATESAVTLQDGTTMQCLNQGQNVNLYNQTLYYLVQKDEESSDKMSIDNGNGIDGEATGMCITENTDYLIACIEMNLAQEYKVINFDFYNDWINGVLYFPRWLMEYRPKRTYFFGLIKARPKVKGCMTDATHFGRTRRYTQQCAVKYSSVPVPSDGIFNNVIVEDKEKKKQNKHKKDGKFSSKIFGKNGGVIKQQETIAGEYVYYYKPCEWNVVNGRKLNLFATDIVLLGSLNECSLNGIPMAFKYLTSSSYKMPTNLALTNMDSDGYLYGNNGSYCRGNNTVGSGNTGQTSIHNMRVEQVAVTFRDTAAYYSGVSSSEEYIGYGTLDQNAAESGDSYAAAEDAFATTEAAGISWNYTGPGQGVKSDEDFYQPGGHFLGLSCNNSQTNFKSCLNLQRICEVGTSMSQRHEKIVGIDRANMTYTTRYYVPTGVIANQDITGGGFRSMFATMNMKTMQANNVDENTGYNKYYFDYLNPNGFDGSMQTLLGYGSFNTKSISATSYDDFYTGLDNAVDNWIKHNSIDKTFADKLFEALHNKIERPSSNTDFNKPAYSGGSLPYAASAPSSNNVPIVSGKTVQTEISSSTTLIHIGSAITEDSIGYWSGLTGENEIDPLDIVYFIGVGAKAPYDFDKNEPMNTYRITKDNANSYYYRFRLGLDDLSETGTTIKKYSLHFYDKNNNLQYLALPQYENSFYFYFGLHDGATAFDEFKSQFFSECPDDSGDDSGYLTLTKTSRDCSSRGSFDLNIYNVDGPYGITIKDSNNDIEYYSSSTTYTTYSIGNLDPGMYYITVKGSDEVEYEGSIEFAIPDVYTSYEVNDFNYRIKGTEYDKSDASARADGLIAKNITDNCGYFDFNKYIEINGEEYSCDGTENAIVILHDPTTNFVYSTGIYILDNNLPKVTGDLVNKSFSGNVITSGDTIRVYVGKENISYNIFIQYKCSGNEISTVLFDEAMIYGMDNTDMYLGGKFLSYNNNNSEGFSLKSLNSESIDWWKTINDDVNDKVTNWALRHYITKQLPITSATFDTNVFSINGKGNVSGSFMLFGQPESTKSLYETNGLGESPVYSNSEKNYFRGYSINDASVIRGTHGFNSSVRRELFGKTGVYNGTVATNKVTGFTITNVENADGVVTLTIGGSRDIPARKNHGILIECGGELISAICTENDHTTGNMSVSYRGSLGPTTETPILLYPVFYYPVIEAPMSVDIVYYTTNMMDTNTKGYDVAFGSVKNGITYNGEFGEVKWFGKNYGTSVVGTEIQDNLLDTTGRTINFGLDSDLTVNTSTMFDRSDNIHFTFSVEEGHPAEIPSDLNVPNTYSPYICSGKSNVIFDDIISLEEDGGKIVVYSKKATNTIPDKNGDIRYFAVTDESVISPIVVDGQTRTLKVKEGETILDDKYYEAAIEKATEIFVGDTFDGSLSSIRFVIGYAVDRSNGNNIKMFKFYKV